MKTGTALLNDITVKLVKSKCKNANDQNLLKNLNVLKQRAKKVTEVSKQIGHIYDKQFNMPVVPISETGEPVKPPAKEEILNPEMAKEGKKSKTVMLYTTITFSCAIGVRTVCLTDLLPTNRVVFIALIFCPLSHVVLCVGVTEKMSYK